MRRIPWVVAVVSILGPFVAGCQSYEEGVEVICEGPNDCSECAQVVPEMRGQVMARQIEKGLSNGEAKKLFDECAMLAPADRAAKLRAEAEKAGLATCPMADSWETFEGTQ